MKDKIGNCDVLNYGARLYIINTAPSTKANIYSIKNGSHAYLVVGNEADGDAVVCDAWAGQVYPLTELNKHLCSQECIKVGEKIYNLMIHYNPNFHKLVPGFLFDKIYKAGYRFDYLPCSLSFEQFAACFGYKKNLNHSQPLTPQIIYAPVKMEGFGLRLFSGILSLRSLDKTITIQQNQTKPNMAR